MNPRLVVGDPVHAQPPIDLRDKFFYSQHDRLVYISLGKYGSFHVEVIDRDGSHDQLFVELDRRYFESFGTKDADFRIVGWGEFETLPTWVGGGGSSDIDLSSTRIDEPESTTVSIGSPSETILVFLVRLIISYSACDDYIGYFEFHWNSGTLHLERAYEYRIDDITRMEHDVHAIAADGYLYANVDFVRNSIGVYTPDGTGTFYKCIDSCTGDYTFRIFPEGLVMDITCKESCSSQFVGILHGRTFNITTDYSTGMGYRLSGDYLLYINSSITIINPFSERKTIISYDGPSGAEPLFYDEARHGVLVMTTDGVMWCTDDGSTLIHPSHYEWYQWCPWNRTLLFRESDRVERLRLELPAK